MGRDSSVGIETRYRLDGPGIESQLGEDFMHTSRPALGSPSLVHDGCHVSLQGAKAAGAWR